MSMMDRILRLMAERKASDVYLSAHAPAIIKINGQYIPMNSQILPVEATVNLLSEVVPPNRIEELKETGELNMAIPLADVGNFRLSAMRQRGTYAAVIRYISSEIPSLPTLNLPNVLADLVMEKRGLILMVGATGAGKSTTLASMLDHRNENVMGHILTIEDPVEFVFRNRKSVVNQREVGSDTETLAIGLKNALRQAPDVILIGEILDATTSSMRSYVPIPVATQPNPLPNSALTQPTFFWSTTTLKASCADSALTTSPSSDSCTISTLSGALTWRSSAASSEDLACTGGRKSSTERATSAPAAPARHREMIAARRT